MTKSIKYSRNSTTYLTLLLQSIVGGTLVAGVFSVIQWLAADFYVSYLETADVLFNTGVLILIIAAIVAGFRWIYVVHKDLHALDKDYSISPGQALARFMIPLYNIWGIWNVLTIMHKYFEQQKGGSKKVYGLNLDRLTNMIYIAWAISMIMNRILLSNMKPENFEQAIHPSLYILVAFSDLFFYGTALVIVMMVGRNLEQKINDNLQKWIKGTLLG